MDGELIHLLMHIYVLVFNAKKPTKLLAHAEEIEDISVLFYLYE